MKGNKEILCALTLIALLTLSVFAVLIPSAAAHNPPINIPSFAYINAFPSPDGVNQPISIFAWTAAFPPTANGQYGDRWTNLTVTVTLPDGSTNTLGPFKSDPVGTFFTTYIPTQTGQYTFQYHFPGYTITNANPNPNGLYSNPPSPYLGDYYEPADSDIVTVQVTSTSNPAGPNYALPTEYWTNPVSQAGHASWASITGDWLSNGIVLSTVNDYTQAPTTAHIAWTKPLTFGGVAGLPSTINTGGDNYYSGLSYEGMFSPSIIINGILYYDVSMPPMYGFMAVDLQTGQQIWYQNATSDPLAVQQGPGGFAKQNYPQLSMGQELDYESPNQHGVISYLWSIYTAANGSNVWALYDPFSGNWISDLVGVPPSSVRFGATSMLADQSGSYLIYTLNLDKTFSVWNSTQCIQNSPASNSQTNGYWMWRPQLGGMLPASLGTTNYTITGDIPPGGIGDGLMFMDQADQLAIYGNITALLGMSSYPTPTAYNMFAISINPDSMGKVMWSQVQPWPAGNVTFDLETNCIGNGVFAVFQKETRLWQGFSATTGELLWTSSTPEIQNHMYGVSAMVYNGELLSGDGSGEGGTIYAYDVQTGALLWSSSTPPMYDTGYWMTIPYAIGAVASNNIYWYGGEHSPGPNLETGFMIGDINAQTGAPVWNITFFNGGRSFAIADGYLAALNSYDNQIYCFGKGPTQTTLQTPLSGVTQGQSFTIQGTVMDISAGTQQSAIAARFPNGVPAVSDDSQTPWMEYVYMQNPRPTDVSGVSVSIDAYEPNGNSIHLGDTHSDASGLYSFQVNPSMLPVTGTYTVIATFAGSNAYWSSSAESSFTVNSASGSAPTASASPSSAPQPTSGIPTLTYIAIAAAVVVIIVIAAAIALKKRKQP